MPLEITYQRPWMYPEQQDAIFDETRIAMIEASTKAGKGLLPTAIVYTPTGFRQIQELAIGDEVLGPDGDVALVEGVYDRGEQAVYDVTFSDGTVITCDGDHLWEVHRDQRDYRRNFDARLKGGHIAKRRKDRIGWPRVMSTRELAGMSSLSLFRSWIPTAAPVAFKATPVPIDPWFLGALIGDGCLKSYNDGADRSILISTADVDILRRVLISLPPDHVMKYGGGHDYRIVTLKNWQLFAEDEPRLVVQIGDLGLFGGSHLKFIPACYRYNSEDVRWEVLRGVFDTDGWVDDKGQPHLEVTSKQLADDVQEVVQSLGGHCHRAEKVGSYRNADGERVECRTVYRVGVVHPDAQAFFWLKRKRDLTRPKKKKCCRKFRSVVPAGSARTICIRVSQPRGLFLTDNFIVTHNTAGCLAWLSEQAFVKGKIGREFWWVAPVYGQAKIAYRRMKTSLPRNVYRQNETELRLTLINGAAIEFRSAEKPDNLYGEDVWAVVMDESSRMREEAWHAVRSTLTHTRGPVRMIGNVHGRKNWFYRLARLAEAGDSDMSYHRLTALDAVRGGVMDADEVEAARRDFHRLGKDGIFRQLYMAEAADDGENPFGLDAIRACCDNVEALSTEYPAAAGVDLAGRGAQNIAPRQTSPVDRDYTAVVMLDREGCATRIERFRKPHTETTEHVARVVGRAPALVDSTGTGDAIVEALQRRGDMQVLGYTFTERSRQELLEHLALYIGEGDVHWPDVDDGAKLRLELESFEYVYRRTGVSWRVPEGAHDDIAMALALCAKRMPWRMKRALVPSGVEAPGGSKWTGNAVDGTAWARYQDSLKPTVVSGLVDESVAVPPLIQGPGAGKWK